MDSFYRIEFCNGKIEIIKSFRSMKDLIKQLFFEYGTEFKMVRPANNEDVNWYGQNNNIKEI